MFEENIKVNKRSVVSSLVTNLLGFEQLIPDNSTTQHLMFIFISSSNKMVHPSSSYKLTNRTKVFGDVHEIKIKVVPEIVLRNRFVTLKNDFYSPLLISLIGLNSFTILHREPSVIKNRSAHRTENVTENHRINIKLFFH